MARIASEALGNDPIDILVDDQDAAVAQNITRRCGCRESWTGEFPVKNKAGDRFSVVTTMSPFYNNDGSLIGIICDNDAALFQDPRASQVKTRGKEGETSFSRVTNSVASKLGLDSKEAVVSKLGLDSQQPIQVAIKSKISDLASNVGNKVRSKMQACDNSAAHHEGGSGDSHHSDQGFFEAALFERKEDACASTARGDFILSLFGVFLRRDKSSSKPFRDSSYENDIPKKLASKAEEWMAKKRSSWPWKGNEQEGLGGTCGHSVWPWVQNEPQKEQAHQSNKAVNIEAVGGFWSSSLYVNSTMDYIYRL
ncbi:PAS domain-containing protein tyrosine kinase family protein [Raphanus sativus]|nr:PAS domain-containing protein tyrosine kinase family protein [Raphanus sativus]